MRKLSQMESHANAVVAKRDLSQFFYPLEDSRGFCRTEAATTESDTCQIMRQYIVSVCDLVAYQAQRFTCLQI